MTRLDRLAAYLALAARRPFRWGVNDCAMGLVFDWVLAERGVDWGVDFRGRYNTARGAQRIIRRAGGLDALIGDLARRHGFVETQAPVPGDVGVVTWRDARGSRLCCALRTGVGWAAPGERGLHVAPATTVMAWSV